MRDRGPRWLLAIGLGAVAVVVIGVVALVKSGGGVPDTVQPIAWDREPCAHCRMLIGEPRHAAQWIGDDGTVASFDDPGCALRYLGTHPTYHRLWFHAADGDRWLSADEVAFLATKEQTPMGSGLLAVPRGTSGAITFGEALRRTTAPGGSL